MPSGSTSTNLFDVNGPAQFAQAVTSVGDAFDTVDQKIQSFITSLQTSLTNISSMFSTIQNGASNMNLGGSASGSAGNWSVGPIKNGSTGGQQGNVIGNGGTGNTPPAFAPMTFSGNGGAGNNGNNPTPPSGFTPMSNSGNGGQGNPVNSVPQSAVQRGIESGLSVAGGIGASYFNTMINPAIQLSQQAQLQNVAGFGSTSGGANRNTITGLANAGWTIQSPSDLALSANMSMTQLGIIPGSNSPSARNVNTALAGIHGSLGDISNTAAIGVIGGTVTNSALWSQYRRLGASGMAQQNGVIQDPAKLYGDVLNKLQPNWRSLPAASLVQSLSQNGSLYNNVVSSNLLGNDPQTLEAFQNYVYQVAQQNATSGGNSQLPSTLQQLNKAVPINSSAATATQNKISNQATASAQTAGGAAAALTTLNNAWAGVYSALSSILGLGNGTVGNVVGAGSGALGTFGQVGGALTGSLGGAGGSSGSSSVSSNLANGLGGDLIQGAILKKIIGTKGASGIAGDVAPKLAADGSLLVTGADGTVLAMTGAELAASLAGPIAAIVAGGAIAHNLIDSNPTTKKIANSKIVTKASSSVGFNSKALQGAKNLNQWLLKDPSNDIANLVSGKGSKTTDKQTNQSATNPSGDINSSSSLGGYSSSQGLLPSQSGSTPSWASSLTNGSSSNSSSSSSSTPANSTSYISPATQPLAAFASGGVRKNGSSGASSTVANSTPSTTGNSSTSTSTTGLPSSANNTAAQNQALAKSLVSPLGWGSGTQWDALVALWTQESSWSATATGAMTSQGQAYGIPQALPSTKLPAAGQKSGGSNPTAQIQWGIQYIQQRYGTPVAAEAHEKAQGWYDRGSYEIGSTQLAMLHKGERVIRSADNTVSSRYGNDSSGAGTEFHTHYNIAAGAITVQASTLPNGQIDGSTTGSNIATAIMQKLGAN
jgi:hypothetical protein